MEPEIPRSAPIPGDFTVRDWLIQPGLGRISRGDTVLRLRPQLVDVLVCLARRAGRTVSKTELLDCVWPGQYVLESGLGRCIAELRQALGDDAQEPIFIETIPKRGYRLIAAVEWADGGGAPATPLSSPAMATVVAGPPVDGSAGCDALAPPSTGSLPAGHDEPVVHRPDTTPPGPATMPGRRRRRSYLLATSALVLAALAATAAVTLWRSPARTLSIHDAVVLVFENQSGEPAFDDTLPLALAIQIDQSPFLTVLSEERVRQELRFMRRPENERLTRDTARDVCQRVGAKAVLAGSVARLGTRYVVGIQGIECQSGTVLARSQATVDGKEAVLEGVGRVASDIRKRLGEGAASIQRHDVPIAQATTGSLPALKAFSQAAAAAAGGRDAQAMELFQGAIQLDPEFALAHLAMAVHLLNMNREGEAVESIKRAFALRDRVSLPERLSITAFYFSRVVRDPFKALETFETMRQAYPQDPIPRINIAAHLIHTGRFERALVEALEATRIDPNKAQAYAVRAEALMALGRLDEAKATIEAQLKRNMAAATDHELLFEIAFVRGDAEGMRRQSEWASGNRTGGMLLQAAEARTALFEGRLETAGRLWQQMVDGISERGDASLAALAMIEQAEGLALLEQREAAVRLVAAALARSRTSHALAYAALALGLAGDGGAAARLLEEYKRDAAVTESSDPMYRPVARGLVALERGDADQALEALAPLRPFETGLRFLMRPAFVRGLAYERRGEPAAAAAEYQRIVENRSVLPDRVLYPVALLRLARVLRSSGNSNGADAACERLLGFWKRADTAVLRLAESRAGCRVGVGTTTDVATLGSWADGRRWLQMSSARTPLATVTAWPASRTRVPRHSTRTEPPRGEAW